MYDPVEEFLSMDKQAGAWGDVAVRAGATIGTIGAGMVMNEAYDAAKSAIGRSRGFKGMMEYNPDLKKQDRKKVQAIYNSLHNVSPGLAADPLVANSWVNRMMYQDEYIDPRTMSDLATAQSRMGSSRKDVDFAGMASQINAAEAFAPLKGGPQGPAGPAGPTGPQGPAGFNPQYRRRGGRNRRGARNRFGQGQ